MTFTLPSIPVNLHWKNRPLAWKAKPENTLVITAGENTDLFIDPQGNHAKNNAPSALFTPRKGDFLLSAKVAVDLSATFDAGVLLVYEQDDRWAKLCLELSPQQQPTIVSVVTRGVSDDCNSVSLDDTQVYLRIAKTGQTFAFHFSTDGRFWHMVRYFTLGELDNLQVGFSSQAPTGQKCTTVFSEISYEQRTLKDIRSGE